MVSASESAHHARSGRALESLRASREAETLAEEAVDLSMPAVVAAATRAARAGTLRTGPREDGDGGERTRGFLFATTDARETHAEVTRALLALLAAPRAAIVADAASLLAEGIESEADRSRAVSFFANGDETDAALAETFALAEALGSVGGWRGGLDAATERMAARHATGALLRALATAYPKAFLAHFASRLESPASAESPAHMSAFLALAEIAREKPRVLERNLDAVAAVVAAASAAATPALRKTCRAGARALATDLAQHSGRVACFASRSRDVERLAVAVEEPEAGETGMAGRAIHVYDLVAGAKTRVLKEEADEDVAGAGEARAAAAAMAPRTTGNLPRGGLEGARRAHHRGSRRAFRRTRRLRRARTPAATGSKASDASRHAHVSAGSRARSRRRSRAPGGTSAEHEPPEQQEAEEPASRGRRGRLRGERHGRAPEAPAQVPQPRAAEDRGASTGKPISERGRNRGPQKVEWSL